MTKLSPQYQAWRARRAERFAKDKYHQDGISFLAGAEAEHEAAKLVGFIAGLGDAMRAVAEREPYPSEEEEAAAEKDIEAIKILRDAAKERLDALLRGGGEG